jgi:hypothetical protein
LATLYLNDLADVVRDAVDNRFEFVRYAEQLAGSQATFDPLAQALAAPPTLVDDILRALTLEVMTKHQPQMVLLPCLFRGPFTLHFESRKPSRPITQRFELRWAAVL